MIRKVLDELRRTQPQRLVRRLLSPDHRLRWRVARRIRRNAPLEQRLRIRGRYFKLLAGEGPEKYLRMQLYLEMAVDRAMNLGLHHCPPCRLLDIGCGNGYFLAAARYFGHDVLGIDIPDNPMFSELMRMWGLPRVEHRIEALHRLPEFDRPFDFITAYMIRFNDVGMPDPWGIAEWRFFLDDCCSRLKPGGLIRLELNPDKRSDYRYLSDATAADLRTYPGATVSADKSLIEVRPPKTS